MSTNHDKRELLKLKQGLIEDSEVIKREEREEVVLRGKKKAENFWYHNKVTVILGVFFIGLAVYFIVDMAAQKRPDISFMFLAMTAESSYIDGNYNEELGWAMARYTQDFDGNGYVYTQIMPINIFSNQANHNALMANQTKLISEIQIGTVRLVIGDRAAFSHVMGGDDRELSEVFVNLSELYPGNENIVEDVLFRLMDSGFVREAGIGDYYWEYTDDLYIALIGVGINRGAAQIAHERSLEILGNIIQDNIVTAEDKIKN